ncbi:hypothetical protein [Rubrivivax gelatinosus]|uniref:hypothetical protein n=1 Tax=Rubrivivax gelatinosus TaxID=28068 RepID=UPI00190390BB|nr:hypothetical protein [Rubrivivax gelatinosus]
MKVWSSKDPAFFKIVLTALLFLPVVGPIVVFWICNFPDRLHPDVQARYPKQVNHYGRWKTESQKSKDKNH